MNNQLLDRLLPPLAVAVRYRKDRAFARELLASGSFTNAVDIASSVTGTSSTMIRKGAIHTIAAALDSMTFPSQQLAWLYKRHPPLAVWALTDALKENYEIERRSSAPRTIRYAIASIDDWIAGTPDEASIASDLSQLRYTRYNSGFQAYQILSWIDNDEQEIDQLEEALGSLQSSLGQSEVRKTFVESVRRLADS